MLTSGSPMTRRHRGGSFSDVHVGKVSMSRRQVLSVAVLVTVLGWSVVLVAVDQPAAAAAVVPTLVLSAEQVVTAMTTGSGAVSAGSGAVSAGSGAVAAGCGAVAAGVGPVSGGSGPVSGGSGAVSAGSGAVSGGPGPVAAGRGPVAADEERLG